MLHISKWINPMSKGLLKFQVTFTRLKSDYLPSMLAEGFAYRHPERVVSALVFATCEDDVKNILTYHYGKQYKKLIIAGIVE